MTENEKKELFIQAWKSVFGVDSVNDDDNFFEVGGDSIKGVQLVGWLIQKGLKLDMLKIYTAPTVAELVDALEETQPMAVPSELLTKDNMDRFMKDPVVQQTMANMGGMPQMNSASPMQLCTPQTNYAPQMQLCTPQTNYAPPMQLCTPPMNYAPPMQLCTPPMNYAPPMQLCTPQMSYAPPMQLCTPQMNYAPQMQGIAPQMNYALPMQLCTPQMSYAPPMQGSAPQMSYAPPMQLCTPPMNYAPPMQLCTPPMNYAPPMQLCTPQMNYAPPMQLCMPPMNYAPPMQLCTPPMNYAPPMQLCTPQMNYAPQMQDGTQAPYMGFPTNAPIQNPNIIQVQEPKLGAVTKSPEDALNLVLSGIFPGGYNKQENLLTQGMNSFQIMQLITRCGEQGYRLRIEDVMKNPTFSGIVSSMKTE